MKRAVLVGVVAFLLGSMTSPKAANENETLSLLCKRYEVVASPVERLHESFLAKDRGATSTRAAHAQRDEAVVVALRAVRDMVCVTK
jgi:hypothetical protein